MRAPPILILLRIEWRTRSLGPVNVGKEDVWDGLAIIRPPRLLLHPGPRRFSMATVELSARWDQSNGLDSHPSSTQVAEGYLYTIRRNPQMDSTASDAMTFDSTCWGGYFHFPGSLESPWDSI